MLTKPQYLYQAKLIIDCLPEDEYNSIPKETLKYIEENMQVDESIKIDPEVELSEQNVDTQTLMFLNDIIQNIKLHKMAKQYENDVKSYIKEVEERNAGFEARVDNINLNEKVERLEKQNEKLPKAKELIEDYKKVVSKKEEEIVKLKEECNMLTTMLNRIPKFIRKIFLRNSKTKLLQEKND